MLRNVALNDLIDEALLRIKARFNGDEVSVSEEEIEKELRQFKSRFRSSKELEKAMRVQGIESQKELRYRMAARIQQEKYIETKIQDYLKVTEEEARQWYEDHKEELAMPERRRVRHIFLATLNLEPEEVKERLAKPFEQLMLGEVTFQALAAAISEDERSKSKGGDLGWMQKKRLPEDFGKVVFSISPSQPRMIQTKLGWHIVEVLEVAPPQPHSYTSLKEEIVRALSDSKRKDAIDTYRKQLRWFNREKIIIFQEVLER